MSAPTALSGTSPKYVMEIFYNYSTVSFRILGRREGVRRLSVADEIEKELDESLPCGDDMVRAERLRACPDSRSDVGRAVFPQHSPLTGTFGLCGMMKSAARPVNEVRRD